jgi:DUF1365 family protein
MEMMPQIMFGQVMHKRLFPKVNGFTYGIYYLLLPLSKISTLPGNWRFGINRPALMSFYAKDHGDKKSGDLQAWAQGLLARYGISAGGEIMLLTMPRIFGHVFNPVSFWFCHDVAGGLRAVICAVNNTFDETHSYICRPESGGLIDGDTWLEAEKVFHVSPFLKRDGKYRFRFALQGEKIGVWIDYYDAAQNKQLLTSLVGSSVPMTPASRRRAFWRYPLVALIALARIHWHAIRLVFKGVKYVPKPLQAAEKTSLSSPAPVKEEVIS